MKAELKKILGMVDNPDISIEEDKRETINLVLYITNILGFLSIVSAIIEYTVSDIPGGGYLYLLFFTPFLFALIFKNRWSTKTLTILFILSAYLISTYIIFNEGFFGATPVLYITIIVFVNLLLGTYEAIITLVICLVSFLVAALLFVNGILEVHPAIQSSYHNWISWTAAGITIIFLGLLISLTIHRIQKKLFATLKLTNQKTKELRESNEELTQIKKHLEELVKERTSEIESKNIELSTSNEALKKLNEDLEHFNSLFVGREFRIKALRDQVKELKQKLDNANLTE